MSTSRSSRTSTSTASSKRKPPPATDAQIWAAVFGAAFVHGTMDDIPRAALCAGRAKRAVKALRVLRGQDEPGETG